MKLRRLANLAAVTFFACAFSLVFPLFLTVQLQAQNKGKNDCGTKAYLDSLPVPIPKYHRVVQLVNCSDQVLLGAANAGHTAGAPPFPVFPREGTWEMQAYGAPNNANVITIDIPTEWEGQFGSGGEQPIIWARTGCRYDPVSNRAQCETGGCSGQYDCSSGNFSPVAASTITEWTFYQESGAYRIDTPDISAVNGASLTVDIEPVGGDDRHPGQPTDFHWLNWNYPLTVHGTDLREPAKCANGNGNIGNFTVKRSDIDKYPSIEPNYPYFGYVIVDGTGKPTQPTGDNVLACLSNCGKYKFPQEAGKTGCDAKTDPNCYAWTTFCAGNTDIQYKQSCDTDADCLKYNGGIDYHIACFHNSGPKNPGRCELRAFYKGSVSKCNGRKDPQPTGPASQVACTNTYGSVNPLDSSPSTNIDYADQPPVADCADVTFGGNNNKVKVACIGDDTIHAVLHGAYTWPNDPQTYPGDSAVYRILFSPEGTSAAITPAQNQIPLCASLPSNYMPTENRNNCSGTIDNLGQTFGIARVPNKGIGTSKQWHSTGNDWPCFIDERGAGDNGVVCRWNPPPSGNCSPPVPDSNVTQGACGRIDSGTALVSGSITPNSGDPLFLEVAIPKVLNSVSSPVSLSGCVPSSGMGAWSMVASQTVHSDQGIVAWYKGTANTSLACQVTVTMANENPAELKLYDVPKFNGTVEVSSSLTGDFNGGPPFPSVSANSATTAYSNDLVLGALLMVDQLTTPITYWTNWLTNGPNQLQCLINNTSCPKDDGTDYLPGHGPYSANSDVGHQKVGPGIHYFHRDAYNIGEFSWAGLAIYVELNP